MFDSNNVKPCPVCESPDTFLVLDRFGVTTFFCTNCEYDWQERQEPDERSDDAGPFDVQ